MADGLTRAFLFWARNSASNWLSGYQTWRLLLLIVKGRCGFHPVSRIACILSSPMQKLEVLDLCQGPTLRPVAIDSISTVQVECDGYS
jgi:hypothetical protein